MKALETLVPAINYLNEFYNSNAIKIRDVFASLEGEKIFTVNGEITVKHKVLLESIKERISKQVKEGHLSMYAHLDIGQSYIYVKFKICLNGGQETRYFCHHLEQSLYIGKMENGTRFISVNPNVFEPLKKVTIPDQIKKINAFHKAEETVRNARRNINTHLHGLIR